MRRIMAKCCDLGRCAAGNIVGRHVLFDVDDCSGSAARWALSHILESPGSLKLPGRNCDKRRDGTNLLCTLEP
jgi:hypothetical protein